MFAIVALVCFVIALFADHVGPLSWVTLGLAFLALHLVWNIAVPGRRTHTTP